MKNTNFNIQEYLLGLKNEDGSSLSEKQLEDYRKALENNGLAAFGEDGLAIQVVQPFAIH